MVAFVTTEDPQVRCPDLFANNITGILAPILEPVLIEPRPMQKAIIIIIPTEHEYEYFAAGSSEFPIITDASCLGNL